MKNFAQFWSARQISDQRVCLCRIGPLHIWMARADKEWGVAIERGEMLKLIDVAQVPPDVVPENLTWEHIAFRDAPRDFKLVPQMPDRPVVVKPSYPITIPPGESATFFTLIPIWVEVLAIGSNQEFSLECAPSRILSDTWFGNYEEGYLCYALAFHAERELDALDPLYNHTVCPLEVVNASRDPLMFEKLCLRTKHLGIYLGHQQLWSSPVTVTFEGNNRESQVQYGREAPGIEPGLKLLTKPRERVQRRFVRMAFYSGFSQDFKTIQTP